MHTALLLPVTALVATGCTTDTAELQPRTPARHVEIGRLPEQPFHDTDQPTNGQLISSEADPTDPAAVAVDLITAGLSAQGLEVIDLGVDTTTLADEFVRVRVAATHRAGPATPPYTSVYELELTRDHGGHWIVTGSRAVG